jgi:uncharacterized membrane protein
MEWVVLLFLLILGAPICFAIWMILRVQRTQEQLEQLSVRLTRLEGELAQLHARLSSTGAPAETVQEKPAIVPHPIESSKTTFVESTARPAIAPITPPAAAPDIVPETPQASPPLPPLISPAPFPRGIAAEAKPSIMEGVISRKINWEQFVGVKLLMWVGGLAAFLTVVFAVKYSFERNWITPALRVAAGFLTGIGLLASGVVIHRRKQYIVGAQTFCATGVVILYATTFACRSVYEFAFFGVIPTFLLMVLITATAFLLAVRLDALVVAVLGICGGFLTPVLLSTGKDQPFGLFGYIALLNAGLMAVALTKRWQFLAVMGALGTVLMQLGWVAEFFVREKYFEHNKSGIAFAVFFGFSVLFCAAWAWAQRRGQANRWLTASAIALPSVALCFGFYLIAFQPLGQRPGFVFGYILLIDLCLLSIVWLEKRLALLHMIAGLTVFLLLTAWTLAHLSLPLLNWALVLYFLFAVLHAVFPFVLHRLRPGHVPLWWGHLFPLIALLMMLVPIFKLDSASLVLWPFVLLLDLVVFGMAILSASALAIIAALLLTLFLAGSWITRAPAQLSMLPEELVIIGGFAVLFFVLGVILARKFMAKAGLHAANLNPISLLEPLQASPEALATQLPALSAILPFVLLIMVAVRLPLLDPSPVFSLALLLIVLLLGLTRLFPMNWLPAVGLACVLALEHAWHQHHFEPVAALTPLIWYLIFTLVFAVFPFLFFKHLRGQVVSWATAALSGPLHFYLVHRLVKAAWPNDFMGLLPIAFALPSIFGLVYLVRSLDATTPKRTTLLALFGGAALFFITLIFPIQFDRQWITIGWALEGAALLWLFNRVPHHGLRLIGVGLIVIAFARLALNPAVLHYHPRTTSPIFNWYLYAYGITCVALFAGVHLLKPPRHLLWGHNSRAVLGTLGTVLAFILLNIEIADYFTLPGAVVLAFEFSGNLARDMTYSISWGAFALVLVVAGIWRDIPGARYAGIVLLCGTLLKLFFHDLANLEALYRIGALLGLAVIAIAASFLYQRFFATNQKFSTKTESNPPAAS